MTKTKNLFELLKPAPAEEAADDALRAAEQFTSGLSGLKKSRVSRGRMKVVRTLTLPGGKKVRVFRHDALERTISKSSE